MNITVTVIYTCGICGANDITVFVPARETSEPIEAWMQTLTHCLMVDHHKRSPVVSVQ